MPILFLILGLFLIMYCFNFCNIQNYSIFKFLVLVSVFIEAGFFFGNVFTGGCSFNILHLIAFVSVLLFSLVKSKNSFLLFVLILLICVLYYMLVNSNLSFMIDYNNGKFICILLLGISLLYDSSIKGMLCLLSSSLCVMLISGYFGFENYSIFVLNFMFCFELCVSFILLSFIKFKFKKYFIKHFGVVSYEKTCLYIPNNFSSISYHK